MNDNVAMTRPVALLLISAMCASGQTPFRPPATPLMTPALPNDLDILSRPVTYLVWDVASSDGRPHAVSLYCDALAELAVNTPDQPLDWSRFKLNGADVLRAGSRQQPMLEKFGDNLR